MYVIIAASEMETMLVPLSKPICKALVPINGKPILQYILDELYSYQADIDEIVIVKNKIDDIQEYLKYTSQDDFFKTKIHCVNRNSNVLTNGEQSLFSDFYSGVEFLVDNLNVEQSEILLWSADELVLNSRKLVDLTTGSFCCSYNKNPVKIYRFDEFPYVVNNLITLNNDGKLHTIKDFLELYKRTCDVFILEEFGSYKVWNTQLDYYKVQSEFIQNDNYNSIVVDIDLDKEQITKTNKYANYDYSYEINELSRDVQYKLWSEANFLDLANREQSIFLPELVTQGVNKRGEYCDWITEELIQGTTLESLLLREDVSKETWKTIFEKIIEVVTNTFHGDDIEDSDELYSSYVVKNIRERYVDDVKKTLLETLSDVQSEFSYENRFDNYFYLDGNAVVEWKMFIDDFISEYEKRADKDTVIYNGTCERLVHNNLTFDNILYDTFNTQLHFINPRSRQWEIVDKNRDFATLYLTCYCGVSALKTGLYSECDGTISIAYPIYEKMLDCVYVLDDLIIDNKFIKMYSILLLLSCSSEKNKYSVEQRVAMLKYARQIKNSYYESKIF